MPNTHPRKDPKLPGQRMLRYLLEHNLPLVSAQIHRTDAVYQRRPGTRSSLGIRRRSRLSFEDFGCVDGVITGRRRVLTLGDEFLDQALQVIDPLAHLIPIITAGVIWGGPVLRSAEFTRSLLVTGRAILAGLLPIALEPVILSVVNSWGHYELVCSLPGATGVARQRDPGPTVAPARLVRIPGGKHISTGIHLGLSGKKCWDCGS